jgi:tetratricopeptide (TPR) repeat protein
VEIAERLESYPAVTLAQMRAHARKDLGQALTFLAKYEEALRALDGAEAQLMHHGTLAHDQAIVRFVRATALQHLRKFDEARALLEECTEVFRDYRDTRLYAKCALATGNLFVRRGDYASARKTLLPILDCEPALVPIARMALGWCAVHLGDGEEALEHFTAAARGYRALGRDVEVERAMYGAATSLLRLGRFEDALPELAMARERFRARGLVEESALSGLDMVEAQMVLGYIDDARELAATLVREFSQAQLNRRAVAALAYLNEAIAASSATPEVVRSVYTYIETLRIDPTSEFAVVN